MRIRFLFFALYRDLVGTHGVEFVVPAGATAADAVQALRASERTYERLPAEPAVAVNRAWAPLETRLRDGDELALVPPVAGG
jgi:molybdopterin converting factor small subunit